VRLYVGECPGFSETGVHPERANDRESSLAVIRHWTT
jgi:hypothetical protein